ncbi:MAG: oligosaccharyl transferase, archaeosortase A system-associated [Methanoregula sp.]|nr:oligosaccharyl transferase, archaeosortase A system-associated [Methanoregula sp.]
MAVAFVLRLIPVLFVNDAGFLYTYDTDGWYTLRQIEVMVNHFPQYNWFDPMTAYPTGKFIDWGPLYPFIAAVLCLITGTASQGSIVFVAGFVSPILAALMVPVVYYLGKTIWSWQCGVVAAGLVAVISYHYFFLSSYGVIGHHIAESFISAIFLLLYIFTIRYIRKQGISLSNSRTIIVPVLLAIAVGVSLFCGLLASPTVIIVIVIIAIFTFVQCALDLWAGRTSEALLAVNGISLLVTSVLLVIFGFHATGMSITQYSPGLVFILLAVIAETVVLVFLSRFFSGKKIQYLIGIAVLGVIAGTLLFLYPPLSGMSQQALSLLSGSTEFSVGVVETLSLTPSVAWDFFGVSIILTIGGFLVLAYYTAKKPRAEWIFLLIWSLVLLLLTVQYQRFDYFSTINIVILSAICIIEPFRWQEGVIHTKISGLSSSIFPDMEDIASKKDSTEKQVVPPERSGKKKKNAPVRDTRSICATIKIIGLVTVILLTVILVGVSIYKDVYLGVITPDRALSPDWVESAKWLGNTTPATGVDYYGEYPVSGYTYPKGSYGIIASWDSGHWITFFGHRIPVTNPFQDNLAGDSGVAAFFLAQNESDANAILAGLGGRYVIVDSDLAVDTFTNLVPWATGTTDISSYISWLMLPEPGNPKILDKVHRFNGGYYETTAARLYNFDGSMTEPQTAEYIQYTIRQVPAGGESSGDVNGYARVIVSDEPVNISSGTGNLTLSPEGKTLSTADYSGLYSSLPDEPVAPVFALKHYRLVHESPNNATVAPFPESETVTLSGIKSVKIFEYVPGAQISGEGIIEIPVKTNTGRTFMYRQESENGTFVVPYATSGTSYGVSATGQYHIVGTDRYINVSENDVMQGNRVN